MKSLMHSGFSRYYVSVTKVGVDFFPALNYINFEGRITRMIEQLEFDLEPSRISANYIVTKSNALIETPINLDLQESRIIYTLISLIQPADEDFKTHFLKVKEMADLLDIQDKNFYKRIREVVTGLQRKTITIRENKGESDLVVNWLSASRYLNRTYCN
jgi:hypothetical protein